MSQPEKIGESPAYWTHGVESFPSPVAQFRMAQLIDLDDRLYENARIVYRFLVGWYHDGHGDALLSMRHVSKVMKARAPQGAATLSHSVVQRAIIALMESGWVVRTFKGRGKGKGASRYVPVLNVLDLAAQGKFPEPSHRGGTVDCEIELSRSIGTVVSHSSGTVEAEPSHSGGTKTLLRDTPTGAVTGNSTEVSAPPALGLAAVAGAGGKENFERVWRAYGRLGNKAASRAAFEAIDNPDVDLIADRAAAWAASARPGQKRIPLEKWLAAEKYDEADRKVEPKPVRDRPAKVEAVPEPDNDNWVGDVGAFSPFGNFNAEIAGCREIEEDGGTKVVLSLKIDSGRYGDVIEHTFYVEADDRVLQERGQAHLRAILDCLGMSDIDDLSKLIGARLRCSINDRLAISYREAA